MFLEIFWFFVWFYFFQNIQEKNIFTYEPTLKTNPKCLGSIQFRKKPWGDLGACLQIFLKIVREILKIIVSYKYLQDSKNCLRNQKICLWLTDKWEPRSWFFSITALVAYLFPVPLIFENMPWQWTITAIRTNYP